MGRDRTPHSSIALALSTKLWVPRVRRFFGKMSSNANKRTLSVESSPNVQARAKAALDERDEKSIIRVRLSYGSTINYFKIEF